MQIAVWPSLRSHRSRGQVACAFFVCTTLALWSAPLGAPENASVQSLTVGKNADGRLELFQVHVGGELRHRWQRESLHDWSAWSSLGGNFSPGVAVATDGSGRIWVFGVDQSSKCIEYSFQRTSNSQAWAPWTKLSNEHVEAPVDALGGADGRLHVFAVAANSHSLKTTWQLENDTAWSAWSDLGGSFMAGPKVVRHQSGYLEVFGLSKPDSLLMRCRQAEPNSPDRWLNWTNMGVRLAPGFDIPENSDGRLEVAGVNAANGEVGHMFQLAAGNLDGWSPWHGLGAKMNPGIAWGRNGDGRIEIFTVSPTNGMIFHIFQSRGGATTNWSPWTDMSLLGGLYVARDAKRPPDWAALTDMGAMTRSRPVVAKDVDGWLNIFALDDRLQEVVNHRSQVAGNMNWTDWSSLERPAAQYLTRNWSIEDGLPDNRVEAIAQTPDGYIWVGTQRGLARFDGVRFDAENLPAAIGITNAAITSLLVDRDGVLWIGSEQAGLIRVKDGRATRFDAANGLGSDSVTALCQCKDSSLWIGTTRGLAHYKNGSFAALTVRDGLPSDIVRSLAEDADGSLWVTTAAGLSRIHGQTVTNYGATNGLPNAALRGIYQDVPRRLWIGSDQGLVFYRSWNFYTYDRRFGLADRLVNVIRGDSQGNIWVGAGSGLNRFCDGTFIEESDGSGASLGSIHAIFEDREGNIWAGSQNGLFRLTPKKLLVYNRAQGLANENVTAVMEDGNGSLWVGTAGGGLNELRDQTIKPFVPPAKFTMDQVLSLCTSRDGGMWMGEDFGGGLTFIKDGHVTHYGRKEGLIGATVRVIHEDKTGHLWIGTSEGLSCLEGGQFITNEVIRRLARRNVRAICEDGHGGLWFGTDDGLHLWQGGKVTRFGAENGLSENRITALCPGDDRTLWIGTQSGGIVRRDAATGAFRHYGVRDGLFSDEILEILEDGIGWLWITSPQGVYRIRRSDFVSVEQRRAKYVTSIAYGRDDGMGSVACGAGKPGGWKTRDGELWFPTSAGLVAIDPHIINIDHTPPPVYIEGVWANAKPLAWRDSGGERLRIPPGRNDLEFHYTALNLRKPDRVRFKYKLDGHDDDWVEAGTRRTAYYNSLAPGPYAFHVIACNNDGVWNLDGASLDLALAPHLWETSWFRALVIFATLGLVAVSARQVTRRRLQRKLERLERQHAIERERMRIAHDIHDDLGGSLTQITFLGEMAKRDLDKPEEAAEHVSKITESARQTVRALDEIVWAVHPEHDRLDHLALYLWQFAEEFFRNTPVRCRVEAPADLPTWFIPAEMRHGIYLLVKEAFNNALKHSAAAEVRLRFSYDRSVVSVWVEDNGRGFVWGDSGRFNNGLENMKRRVEGFGGQFSCLSGLGRGTRLQFSIPLHHVHSN